MTKTAFDLSKRFQTEALISHSDLAALQSRLTGDFDLRAMSRDEALDLIGRIQATTAVASAVLGLLVNAQDHGAEEATPDLSDEALAVIEEIDLALDAYGVRASVPA